MKSLIAVLLATVGGWAVASGALGAGGLGARPQHWRVLTLPTGAGVLSHAEPGIATGPNGMVLIDAASANTGAPPTLWISRDNGHTWGTGRDFDATGAATGDADVAVGPDAYLYALDLAYNPNPPAQPTNPTVLVYRSRDGASWSGPASFPPPHGLDQPDRPWLAIDPFQPSVVDVVNSEGGGNIVIWQSRDHGSHFAGPYPVSGGVNTQAALALSSRPLFDPTRRGRLFMLYEAAGVPAGPIPLSPTPSLYEFPMTQLWLAVSTDGGLAWANRLVLDTGKLPGSLKGATLAHLLVASSIDRAGDLFAALSLRQADATQTSIYLLHSTDGGRSWSAPSEVLTPTSSNVMPAMAVAPGGTAYLSWYGSHDPGFGSSSARWVEMFAKSADPLAPHPRFAVSQVSGPTPVHIGGIDTAGTAGANSGANWGLRDFQSIALDGCGRPQLAWANDNGPASTQTAAPSQPCARVTKHRRHTARHRHRRPRSHTPSFTG